MPHSYSVLGFSSWDRTLKIPYQDAHLQEEKPEVHLSGSLMREEPPSKWTFRIVHGHLVVMIFWGRSRVLLLVFTTRRPGKLNILNGNNDLF